MVKAYVSNTESVVAETFDDDTVLINFLTGTYFSLRGSAPAVWNLLQAPTTADAIAVAVADNPESARDAIGAMLDKLAADGCIIEREMDELELAALPVRAPLSEPFTPPVIETFHDLQELIVVDPVHEVDQIDGWPHRPPAFTLD